MLGFSYFCGMQYHTYKKTIITDEDITAQFLQRLQKENLSKEANYLAFTNRHWERYKAIKEDFCNDIGIYSQAMEVQAPLQAAVMEYINTSTDLPQ